MKNLLKKYWRAFVEFILTWHESWSIPVSVGLYLLIQWVIHIIDPRAGAYPLGYFLKPFMAMVYLVMANGISWALFKFSFPMLYKALRPALKSIIDPEIPTTKEEWQSVYFSVCIWAAYFFSVLWMLKSL